MNMPEEFTVPQAASYLNVSEETVRRNIRSKAPECVAPWNAVVHPPRCTLGFCKQLRSEDRPNTTGALNARRACVCENLLTTLSK